MASGTPVLTFDIPGPDEYVVDGYNGYLAKSIEDMVSKCTEIYEKTKSGSYWELCQNARSTSRKYDWNEIVPKLEGMFSDVINKSGH